MREVDRMDEKSPKSRLACIDEKSPAWVALLFAFIFLYVLGLWGLKDLADLARDYLRVAGSGLLSSGADFFPYYTYGCIAALKMAALVPGVAGLVLLWKGVFPSDVHIVFMVLGMFACILVGTNVIDIANAFAANRDVWGRRAFWVCCATAVLLLILCMLCAALLVRGEREAKRDEGTEADE